MKTPTNGAILLYRKFKRHWLWTTPREFSEAEAWLDMLMSANWEQHEWTKHGITIERGQFPSSESQLAKAWGWSRKKVRCFIKKLIDDDMLRKHSTKHYTIFEIVNFDKHQPDPNQREKNKKSTTANKEFDAEFDAWWEAYPNKKGKADARKHWRKLRKSGVELQTLWTALDNYKREVQGKEKQYIMHGSTFLGPGRRWEDYLQQPEPYQPPPEDPQIAELRRRRMKSG